MLGAALKVRMGGLRRGLKAAGSVLKFRKRSIQRATGAVLEELEQRQLLSNVAYYQDFSGSNDGHWFRRAADGTQQALQDGIWGTTRNGVSFLGRLGRTGAAAWDAPELVVAGLPKHETVTVDFDLYIIHSWDGNGTRWGPDFWNMDVKQGGTWQSVVSTTFNNHPSGTQSYPDLDGNGDYPAGTGLPQGNTNILMYPSTFAETQWKDTRYHLTIPVTHTSDTLEIRFSTSELEAMLDDDGVVINYIDNESWGLDNVRVTTSDDLDADTDNNSPTGALDRSDAEDIAEGTDPGKWIAATGTLAPNDTTHRFVPLVLDCPEYRGSSNARFRLNFNQFSDPANKDGILRLWRTDGSVDRSTEVQINSGEVYTADQLFGSLPTNHEVTFYMEAVNTGADTITCQVDPSNAGSFADLDSVRITSIDQRSACPCCGGSLKTDAQGRLAGEQTDVAGAVPRGIGDDGRTCSLDSYRLLFTGNAFAVTTGAAAKSAGRRIYDRIISGTGESWVPRAAEQGWSLAAEAGGGYVEASPAGERLFFDQDGKLVRVQTADGIQEDRSYDAEGRLQAVSREVGGWVHESQYAYDAQGRLSTVTTGRYEVTTLIPSANMSGMQATATVEAAESLEEMETLRQVAYAYTAAGDLETVTVKDAANNTLETTYYRYYTDGAQAHALKYVLGPQAYARATAALPRSVAVSSDGEIAPYADEILVYDEDFLASNNVLRVKERKSAGAGCSLCGGQGSVIYRYNMTDDEPEAEADPLNPTWDDGVNAWKYKVMQTLPDGSYQITFSNYREQPMLEVHRKGTSQWITYHRYDEAGREILTAYPSAVTGYNETSSYLVNAAYLRSSAGKVVSNVYYSSTTATATVAGGVAGMLWKTQVAQGESGSPIVQDSRDYFAHNDGTSTLTAYRVAHDTRYSGANETGGQTTSYNYTLATDGIRITSLETVSGAVSTAHHGSNVTTSSITAYDSYGRPQWSRDEEGFISYTAYDDSTGAVVLQIEDVKESLLPTGVVMPTGWHTPAAGGLHLTSSFEVDAFGRTTKAVDPEGHITYTVYNDVNQEVRTYAGWNSTTHQPTGPIHVSRQDLTGTYDEQLSFTWSGPSGLPVNTNGVPTGTESLSSSYARIQSLGRSLYNDAGQMVETRSYFSLSGLTYGTQRDLGTRGTHYLSSTSVYDTQGRLAVTADPTGSISHSFYDTLSRSTAAWIGTDDVPTVDYNGDGTIDLRDFRWYVATYGTAPSATNMVQVSSSTYDYGLVGDSWLTSSTSYSDSASYLSQYVYDWRGRRVGAVGPDGVGVSYTLDNLGQVTEAKTYANASVDAQHQLVVAANKLRGQSASQYDEQGRVWQSSVYEVDLSGNLGDRLTTNFWYSPRGMLAKTQDATGLFSKSRVDSAGRLVASYISCDAAESAYADAMNVTGDTVIEQSNSIYDRNSQVVTELAFRRLSTDTTSTGELTAANSYASGAVNWYDAIGRRTGRANYGHESGAGTRYLFNTSNQLIDSDADGLPDEAELTTPRLPNTSSDYIAYKWENVYDANGHRSRITNNKGKIGESQYDLMGRTTRDIANYVDGTVLESETDTDQTTEFVYDASGRIATQRGKNPKGSGKGVENQDTKYLYTSILDPSLLTATVYPDSTDSLTQDGTTLVWTITSGTDHTSATYDRLGRKLTSTDQRGVVHTYTYDTAGRVQSDAVTTLPAGVTGTVRRLEYSYDDLGRVSKVTSYDAPSGGNVVNEIGYTFDDWGNVSQSQQACNGPVQAGTPAVQYVYEDGAVGTEAKYVRLAYVTYPGGRQVRYNYASSGVGMYLSRLDNIANDAGGTIKYAQYSYLGADTITQVAHPGVTGGLNLSYGTEADGFSGFDRFGQIVRQEWKKDNGTLLDGQSYTYDGNGNRLGRGNLVNSSYSETYAYDGLDRLIDANRNGSDLQSWSLDSLGNWNQFTEGGVTQTRQHNAANEIDNNNDHLDNPFASITGNSPDWIDPTYDAAGNTTSGPRPGEEGTRNQYAFDAWNRMTDVYGEGSPGLWLAHYEYDALGRRIEKTVNPAQSTPAQAFYYNESGQVVEERNAFSSGFSTDGKVLTGMGHSVDSGTSMVRLSDGKILVAGSSHGDFSVARYNADGTLDTSFDADGRVTVDFGGDDVGEKVLVDGNGKIILAGTSGGNFVVARLNASGTLDTSFSTDGKMTVDFGSTDTCKSAAVQSDNKVVLAGYSNGNFAVARLTDSGNLDSSFDVDGKQNADFGATDQAFDVKIQSDGKIVLAGNSASGASSNFALARFLSNGTLDGSFGTAGKVTTDMSGYDWVSELAVTDAGIVAAGVKGSTTPGVADLAIARYSLANGTLDTSFGTSGKVIRDLIGEDRLDCVAISNGTIVVGGVSNYAGTSDFILSRYSSTGTLDTSFGSSGTFRIDFGGSDEAWAVAAQDDGSIIAAGTTQSGSTGDFAVARISDTGTLDLSFDADGKLTSDFPDATIAQGVAVQKDGKIVVGGYAKVNGTNDFAVARYNPDGSLDASFGTGGQVTVDLGGDDVANCLAVDSSNRILLAGNSGGNFQVIRLTSSGTLDSGFGTSGKATVDFGGTDVCNSMVVDDSDRVVLAGTYTSGSISDFAVARLTATGAADTNFSGDGKVTASINPTDQAFDVKLQSDGKIVVGGNTVMSGNSQFALARFSSGGIPDSSFGTSGMLYTDMGGYDWVTELAIAGDRIYAAGVKGTSNGTDDLAVACYSTINGGLVGDFDGDGKLVKDLGRNDWANALALQVLDGKVVVAGESNGDFIVARFTTAGAPDNSFDGDCWRTVDFGANDRGWDVAIEPDGEIVVAGQSTANSPEAGTASFAVARLRADGSLDDDQASGISQYVWDVRYIDAPVVRFQDANGDGDCTDAGDSTLYVMNDANFNVTGLVDASTGNVVERYAYTPYGERTVLSPAFDAQAASSYDWAFGHQGLMHDQETGLVYNRARYLHPTLGRFGGTDPRGDIDGMNLYQYAVDNPGAHLDPEGTAVKVVNGQVRWHAYESMKIAIRNFQNGTTRVAPDLNRAAAFEAMYSDLLAAVGPNLPTDGDGVPIFDLARNRIGDPMPAAGWRRTPLQLFRSDRVRVTNYEVSLDMEPKEAGITAINAVVASIKQARGKGMCSSDLIIFIGHAPYNAFRGGRNPYGQNGQDGQGIGFIPLTCYGSQNLQQASQAGFTGFPVKLARTTNDKESFLGSTTTSTPGLIRISIASLAEINNYYASQFKGKEMVNIHVIWGSGQQFGNEKYEPTVADVNAKTVMIRPGVGPNPAVSSLPTIPGTPASTRPSKAR